MDEFKENARFQLKPNPFIDTTINYQMQVAAKLNIRHDKDLVQKEEILLT